MKNIALTINGKKISSPPGASILAAAEKNGIHIPTLCTHADLAPYGACRICLVEDESTGRLMASCVTPAAQDMTIRTHSPRVIENRKNIVRLMIAEHPESCIVCNKGNRCELRKVAAELGVAETGLYPMPNYKPFETLNPFIARDLSKCILCGRCIRADHELVAVGAIDYNERGFASRPATLHENPLEASRCTFCGTCVSMCPTGALSVRNGIYAGTPEKEETSICGFCGAGCSLAMGVASATGNHSNGRIVEVNPSAEKGSVNGATLCVRGHFAHDFLSCEDRLVYPMIGRTDEGNNTTLQPADIDTALSLVAGRLGEIKRRHGPDSIGFIGSTRCSNEENYLLQKIARVLFSTNNVTTCGTVNGQALLRRLDEKTGGSCRTSPLSALENAEAIVSVLSDPEHTVPVAGYHIKRAVKKGAPLVVVDPQRSDLAAFGGIWLHPELSAGGGIFPHDMVDALTARILCDNGADRSFIDRFTSDPGGWLAAMSAADPDTLAQKAGISPETIQKAASLLKGRKIAFVLPCDLLERQNGKETLDAVFNLALVTGSIHPGSSGQGHSGFFIPSVDNNLVGALDMGCVQDMLPGRRPLADEEGRTAVEKIWEAALPRSNGYDIHGMVRAAEDGTLKALYIMGENLLRSLPDPDRVRAALEKLDFIVVQDIIQNRTAELAHVLLPAASFAEKQGSFTNMEGRIQGFTPVIAPPGEALPDWSILAMLARKSGYPEPYNAIEKIRREIRNVVPMYGALGTQRRDWIRKPESGNAGKFEFSPIPEEGRTLADSTYPLTAFIGSLRWHLGSGTRTSRSARIRDSGKTGEINISPKDAETLGLKVGKTEKTPFIRVLSPFGAIERPFAVNRALSAGNVFIPQGFSGNDVVRIADFDALASTGSGWRSVPVRIEKI